MLPSRHARLTHLGLGGDTEKAARHSAAAATGDFERANPPAGRGSKGFKHACPEARSPT
jgi:hypothetical protein